MSILTRPRPPRFDLPPDPEAPEALIEEARRRARRRRRGYAAFALVAAAVGLLAFYGFDRGGKATGAQDGDEPPASQAANQFAKVDGCETTVPGQHIISASLSPDGSQVVCALFGPGYAYGDEPDSGIYVVETDGGRPHLLKKFGRRQWYTGPSHGWYETTLWQPTFSPDGTKIAYIDGMGDWGNGLRVMNADGSHVRVLLDSDGKMSDDIGSHTLAWSPDGSRLAFHRPGGIWVIGADGSGLRKLIPGGTESELVAGWLRASRTSPKD